MGKRRDVLLSRKGRVIDALTADVEGATMPVKDREVALRFVDGLSLLLDVLIDIAHPVE